MATTKLTLEDKEQIKLEASKAPPGTSFTKHLQMLAERYGVGLRNIQHIVYGRKSQNRSKEHFDQQGGYVKGRSVLYDSEGNLKLEWVKTVNHKETEAFKALVDDLCERIPSLPPVPAPVKSTNYDHLLAVYPMGDPHFGLYSWHEETGNDFDLDTAERDLCNAVDRLVASAPPCPHALIVNLGDFFHADTMDNQTWRSGNQLDVDSRWLKVLRTGIRALIRCVQSALTKHQKVTVICAIGNHDDHSSMFLMTVLSHLFADDSRVTIVDSPTIKHYYRFGKVLIGVHHGHTIKMQDLPMQMATDRKEDWGETRHFYWLTGHIHHDSRKEYNGVIVESFRTLAGRDAWAAQMGYHSGRDMKCILFHSEYGEVERHTVSVEMLAAEV